MTREEHPPVGTAALGGRLETLWRRVRPRNPLLARAAGL